MGGGHYNQPFPLTKLVLLGTLLFLTTFFIAISLERETPISYAIIRFLSVALSSKSRYLIILNCFLSQIVNVYIFRTISNSLTIPHGIEK